MDEGKVIDKSINQNFIIPSQELDTPDLEQDTSKRATVIFGG
jgi:hypothetical protein